MHGRELGLLCRVFSGPRIAILPRIPIARARLRDYSHSAHAQPQPRQHPTRHSGHLLPHRNRTTLGPKDRPRRVTNGHGYRAPAPWRSPCLRSTQPRIRPRLTLDAIPINTLPCPGRTPRLAARTPRLRCQALRPSALPSRTLPIMHGTRWHLRHQSPSKDPQQTLGQLAVLRQQPHRQQRFRLLPTQQPRLNHVRTKHRPVAPPYHLPCTCTRLLLPACSHRTVPPHLTPRQTSLTP